MNLNRKPTPEEIAAFLVENDNFLIVTHQYPDGDAIGAVFSTLNFLRENGKSADVLLPDTVPDKYANWVTGGFRSEVSAYELTNYSACIMVDNPKLERAGVGSALRGVMQRIETINIDHHPDNEEFAAHNLVVPTAAASAEIMLTIFKACPGQYTISSQTASLLMLGMVMDTGGFRFDNTSPATLRHAAELIELGADYSEIVRSMFFSRPLRHLEFEAELLKNHLKRNRDGRYAWFFIPPELIEQYQINMRDTEGLIELLRSIDGTDIVAILQRRDEGIKFSLRSKDSRYPVGAIARSMNGGGHELAAGGMIKIASIESAEQTLMAKIDAVLSTRK
ncbi:MAG: bifunctional oligoribonuclease/PAP phosphatase NrnA [Victivallaceae bacterium]|nr:bifunctional oligoribonuclease/PAP phosphatase NrnA [Victivallaceae bacterium]